MSKKDTSFDFEKALEQLRSGKPLTGKSGILTPLIKDLTEAALDGEIEAHLAGDVEKNRRNGRSKKTMKSSAGSFELRTPRDRNGGWPRKSFLGAQRKRNLSEKRRALAVRPPPFCVEA